MMAVESSKQHRQKTTNTEAQRALRNTEDQPGGTLNRAPANRKKLTQSRQGAKTQRNFFQLCRASASSVPERRQVGAGFGKQACLSLCLPFGFRLRLTQADRAGGSPVGPGWGQSRREPGCTRSVLRQEENGRHEHTFIRKVGWIQRSSQVGNGLAHGARFPSAESGRSPRLPGSNTVQFGQDLCVFASLRLCVSVLCVPQCSLCLCVSVVDYSSGPANFP